MMTLAGTVRSGFLDCQVRPGDRGSYGRPAQSRVTRHIGSQGLWLSAAFSSKAAGSSCGGFWLRSAPCRRAMISFWHLKRVPTQGSRLGLDPLPSQLRSTEPCRIFCALFSDGLMPKTETQNQKTQTKTKNIKHPPAKKKRRKSKTP